MLDMPEPHNASSQPAGFTGHMHETSLSTQVATLLRHYIWVLFACSVVGIAVAMAVNIVAAKAYTANADILLTEDQSAQFRLESGAASSLAGLGPSQIDTQIAILKSRRLALETIRVLNLQDNPKFIGQSPNHRWDITKSVDRQILVARFLNGVIVTRTGRTTILNIAVISGDPQLSADICNQLISTYKANNFEDNFTATQEVTKWLGNQLSGLRGNLESEQQQLVALQKSIGVVGLDQSQTVLLARLSGLNGALTAAEATRLVQEARVTALRSAEPGVLDVLANDPVLNQLNSRAAELRTELASASAVYGQANPRLTAIHGQLDQLKGAIAAEQRIALTKATKELSADIQNEESLRQELQAAKATAYAGSADFINYNLARQQYEGDRALYQGLQQRLQEAGIIAGLHSSSIRSISVAEPPLGPSSPQRRFNVMLGLIFGLCCAAAWMFLLEMLDTKLRSVQDVETSCGIPVLGVIPRVSPEVLVPSAFIPAALKGSKDNWSQVAEAYRILRSSLLLSRAGGPPKVMVITSAKPAEGKTSVTSLTAAILALSGSRVLLIDGDMRRPTIHARFSLNNQSGLSTLLSSGSSLESAIQRLDNAPTLDILTSGPIPPMPSELLASPSLAKLLEEAREVYDFILIDTPPILTVTDASALFRFADGGLLVVRSGIATRKGVTYAVEVMVRLGAPIMGAVLNSVDTRSVDYSDYYSSSYGYFASETKA